MGFFSWNTSEGKSISNRHSDKGAFTVYMVTPDNTRYKEDSYDGYGVFDGVDFYDLVDELNNSKPRGEGDRGDGIDLFFDSEYRQEPLILPRFTEDPEEKWEDLNDPEYCPYQGYFYGD